MTSARIAIIVLLSLTLFSSAQTIPVAHKSQRGPRRGQRDIVAQTRDLLGLRTARTVDLLTETGDDGVTRFDVDINGVFERITLETHSNRSPTHYEVLVQHADGSITSAKPGPVQTYRGQVAGKPGSLVAASRSTAGFLARIRLAQGDEYWLEPIANRVPGAPAGMHVLYTPEDVLPHGRSCANDVRKQAAQGAAVRLAAGGGVCIAELGCDADVEYFNDYGTVPATEARINAVMNAVNMQYEAEVGITHQITTIVVRTANPDPYTSTDAETRLCEFITEWTNNQSGIQRDVAQLFTGVEIDNTTIGIAADIGGSGICVNSGACTGGPFGPLGSYCMSQSDFNGNLGCATDLSAHELGHLWGAFHCSPSCPGNTMNPGITCANTFNGTSISSITAYRDTRFCLDGSCQCNVSCAGGSTAEGEPLCGTDYDDTYNGGCNSTVPVWSAISLGATVCGAGGTFTVGGTDSRDTDWYQFTLAQDTIVQWCVEAEFPALIGFVDDGGGANCAGAAFVTSTTTPPCQQECISATLAAGTWTAFVASEVFSNVPCGAIYNATLTSQGACCDGMVCSIASQTDCTAQGGAYQGDGSDCESTAGSSTTYAQTVNQNIPDDDPGNPLVTVLNVPDTVTIGDIDLDLELTHTWVGDLVVTLEHGGTSVTLIDRPGLPDIDATFGCSSNDYDITLDDEGSGGAIEDLCLGNNDTLPPSPPSYVPNNAMSAFDGVDASGNWTLTIADFAAPDPGTLIGWAVVVTAQGPDPCDNPDLCAGVDCSAFDDDCAVGVCNPVDGSCGQDTATPGGQVCRAATGPCDVAETCDGLNPACPTDQFASGPCDDGNACTTNDSCSGGVCVGGTAPVCDDGNPCTTNSCDTVLGCQTANNTAPCDDSNACTENDACADGACGGDAVACDDGNPCTTDSCDTGLGCQSVNNTASCDDGDACTSGEVCGGGVCGGGTPADCDDGNPCTTNSCDTVLGCQTTDSTAPCDDGNACTENDACSSGACGGDAVSCDDGNPCTTNSCDSGSGCQTTNNTAACDDGDACTTSDTCSGGACVGSPLTCEDGNACTDDTCDLESGCVFTDNTASCDDGNACTSNDTCSEGTCSGTPAQCDDGNICTDDFCVDGGCVHTANTAACDDDDPCTDNDACAVLVCAGTPLPCDDGNVCTDDSCSAGQCLHQPNTAACDDADACTENDVCAGGVCSGDILPCDDGNACTDDACMDGTCVNQPNTAACDDGDLCTENDVCAGGVCGGDMVDCDDGNACTDDACEPATGCVVMCVAAGTPCDTGEGLDSGLCNGSCACSAIGPGCSTNSECHDQNDDGLRDDACIWWSCDAGTRMGIDIVFADMGGPFGECPPDGVADGNDRFHALNCFANEDPSLPPPSDYPCEDAAPIAFAVDPVGAFGVCNPDGVCDGNDAFAALNAFADLSLCSCPLDPAPQFAPDVDIVGRTTLRLVPDTLEARRGDLIEIDIVLDTDVKDLRGYQLHLAVNGGENGTLEVVDLAVERRRDAALGDLPTWQATNIATAQVLVGTDDDGVFAGADSYLATAVLRVSDDAAGVFSIDVLTDAGDSAHRTFLFPTPAHGAIAIDGTAPAAVRIIGRERRLRR